MKIILITLITVVALNALGCDSQTLDDVGISAKVKGNLATDSETSAIKIGVDTSNGIVTLSGVVPTEREKGKAEQVARSTEGVKQVVNNITINPDSIGATNAGEKVEEAVTDAAMLAKIKAKLLAEGITGVDVDVVSGTVTLKGTVESQQRITQASDLARSTNGISRVDNQLTVKQ